MSSLRFGDEAARIARGCLSLVNTQEIGHLGVLICMSERGNAKGCKAEKDRSLHENTLRRVAQIEFAQCWGGHKSGNQISTVNTLSTVWAFDGARGTGRAVPNHLAIERRLVEDAAKWSVAVY